jgi:8-oxo-dGTP diphosphatase
VAVVRHQGQVLIGRRPQGVPLAGLWEFPGGKVEPGEDHAVAATRECREETGLAVGVRGELARVTHDYPHGRVELVFLDCVPQEAVPAPREPYRWVPQAELGEFEFPPANAAVIARLLSDAR